MTKIKLHWQILISLVLAVVFGLYFPDKIDYVSWMGEVFIKGLKMLIVPLILSSIISGVANIGNAENLGRLSIKTFSYYMITSLLAIVTGLFFVNLFKPGVGADLGLKESIDKLGIVKQPFSQTLLNIVPDNIFKAFVEGQMLSIIFFSILFGFFITQVDTKYKTFLTDFFNSTLEVVMKLTMFIIKFTPLGVFGIVAKLTAEQAGDTNRLISIVGHLSIYMVTILVSLIIHSTITLTLFLKFVGKVNPIKHAKIMVEPLLTAFSTSSSNATLPLTMAAIENKAGVSNKITSFTLPLGATINMDGTALYECVAAMFIAQAYGIEMSFVQQMIIVFTALLASIGAAGIPMAGVVMMSIILSAVGLPLEGIGLILAVDRILDMCRTVVNVYSDSCGAVIIAKSEGEKLKVE